ncbi:MAG: hypothetical protein ACMG57_03720, partial [Candidatus Dojkabacteria bacterium]
EDLTLINKYSRIKFNPGDDWDHKFNNHFHDRIFFLVKVDNLLKAYGTLREITLLIDNRPYVVLGISGIASIEERKGFGKILMQAMVSYSKDYNKTIVGFCSKDKRGFYLKSGLKLKDHGERYFIYRKEDGTEEVDVGDVIYYSSAENEVIKAIEADKKIFHLVPHW